MDADAGNSDEYGLVLTLISTSDYVDQDTMRRASSSAASFEDEPVPKLVSSLVAAYRAFLAFQSAKKQIKLVSRPNQMTHGLSFAVERVSTFDNPDEKALAKAVYEWDPWVRGALDWHEILIEARLEGADLLSMVRRYW